jgi:Dolichyl-phosphate-mannose-protein mannosyltransferase
MTDELQVARLATSIAEDYSLVPTIRGTYYAAHSQLYPLLLSPFYGTLSPPDAATAAHLLNVLLLVSTAIPAYLLARAVSGSDTAGYVAAALTAVTPWLVLSSTLLTENAAYPAFTWSVLLCQRAIAHPSHGRDAAALAGVALAYMARTQLVLLAFALPLALVLHEIGCAVRERSTKPVRAGVRRSIASHRVLGVAYLTGVWIACLLVATGQLGTLVGNYVVSFEGDLVPSGFWRAAVEHIDQVALGVGVLPVVLSISWLATTAVHGGRRDAHAFAALLFVLAPLLVLQVTSFDLRFTPGQFIQDRYLFYLVPLFAVGCAAWLSERRHLRTRLVGTTSAGVVVVALLYLAPAERRVVFWAAPAAAFRPALGDAAGWAHLEDVAFLQVTAALAVLLVVVLAWRAPRVVLAVTASSLVVFGAAQTTMVLERYVEPSLVRPMHGPRDWIDASVPRGASVSLVPGGVTGPVAWWEAELWNHSVDRELRIAGRETFTPFPVLETAIDAATGRLVGEQPSDYLVVAAGETSFGLATARTVASKPPLRLIRVRRPYRLLWATVGLTPDGWMLPGKPVTLRVFGGATPERRTIRLTLASSRFAPRRFDFAVFSARETQRWSVDPGGARPPVDVTVCAPAGGHVDIRLFSRGEAQLLHGRTVSLHLEQLIVSRPSPCTAS